jgi:osmotically-inducible protein OsmY
MTIQNRSRATHITRVAGACALLGAAVVALSACAPLLIGGAMVSGGLMATDRRTTGTQIEDESIELKAASRVRDLATLGRVSVTSYNRLVLLTGEVPGEPEKKAVEQAVARIENVRSVVNELAVAGNISVGARSNDALLTTKVKATLVDAADVQANAFKVVSDRGNVYLMGRVSEREGTRAADLARSIPGVQKVVRVFDILTEDELSSIGRPSPVKTAPAASAAGT